MGGGGAVDRSENAPLAQELAHHFTVINYDRRGRAGSGDTAPYAIEREFEDIAALIGGVGGSAFRYGVFEVPYDVYPVASERHSAYIEELTDQASASPLWPSLMANAPTPAYDNACLNDGGPPYDRLAAITQPVLVLSGKTIDSAMAELGAGFFDDAADAIVATVPNAVREVIPQAGHLADPKAVAPVLRRFLAA